MELPGFDGRCTWGLKDHSRIPGCVVGVVCLQIGNCDSGSVCVCLRRMAGRSTAAPVRIPSYSHHDSSRFCEPHAYEQDFLRQSRDEHMACHP